MPLLTICQGCGKQYRVDEKYAGKKAKCKNCGASMLVPMPAVPKEPTDDDFDFSAMADMEGSAQVDASAPMAMTAPPPSASAAPSESSAPPIPGVAKSLTRRKIEHGKPAKFQFLAGLKIGVITAFICGGILIFLGWKEYSLNASAKKPQLISCLELGRDGPGDNNMVELVKFGLSPGYSLRVGNSHFIPAFALDSEYGKTYGLALALKKLKGTIAPPDPIQVIIKTQNVDNVVVGKLEDSLQGMIVNNIDPLTPSQIALFKTAYPLTNFAKVWIVEEGRSPGSPIKFLCYFSFGALFILVGLFMFFMSN
jgi:hypothetical protein